MSRHDQEERGISTNGLVIGDGHRDRFGAGGISTLAKVFGALEARNLIDSLVDLTEDGFVLTDSFGTGIHGGSLCVVTVACQGWFPPSKTRAGWPLVNRDTRREENQKLFRGGNESLHDAAVNAGVAVVPFLCECADLDCLGRVEVAPGEWEAVAAKENHFLMIAGHRRSEGEEVVGQLGGYQIARKPS